MQRICLGIVLLKNDLKTDVNDSEKLLICFCYDVVFVTMYVFGGQVLG